MILPAAQVFHESVVAAQFPFGSFGAALNEGIDDAPCDLWKLGLRLNITGKGGR